ncbi:unnamed protein product [Linum tenue]|uniref:HIT-type domain-containing protein n=1 Tax=Linum tenue TaxID=586396 RepID=A0AAV0KJI1_9ROSI|nr:unnamed protein product [Linum tenue]
MEERRRQQPSPELRGPTEPNPNQNFCQEAQRTTVILCVECKEKAAKYKCPGCSLRTCSLPCVKSHKHRTGCSGKREVAPFVPMSQFDDKALLSDYNFLEEAKRAVDSGARMRVQLRAYPQFRLPVHLQSLKRAASSRRTNLLLLPSGMSRREKNQTRYDRRKKSIFWTIEWRFRSTDVVLVDHGVNENSSICSEIQKHLSPGPWKHKLKQFCEAGLESLTCFIRKYPRGKSPFRELDIKAPLKQQLGNLSVLEYPVIYVLLPSQSCDFEVVEDLLPMARRPEAKNRVSNDDQVMIPNGVPFREEEIIEEEEEENAPSGDTQVYDLLAQGEVKNPGYQEPAQKATDNPAQENSLSGNNLLSCLKDTPCGIFDDMDFDFDQSLIDKYSDIIEINTDDFLDFEGDLPMDMGGNGGDGFLRFNMNPEELEEGEIAE